MATASPVDHPKMADEEKATAVSAPTRLPVVLSRGDADVPLGEVTARHLKRRLTSGVCFHYSLLPPPRRHSTVSCVASRC